MFKLPGDPYPPPGCAKSEMDRRNREPIVAICLECGQEFTPEDDEEECKECRLKDDEPNESHE